LGFLSLVAPSMVSMVSKKHKKRKVLGKTMRRLGRKGTYVCVYECNVYV
jgi:hypothetical protein